jgi:hypothetical protein
MHKINTAVFVMEKCAFDSCALHCESNGISVTSNIMVCR